MKKGLTERAKQARQTADWNLKKSKNQRRDPRTAYEHQESARHGHAEADKLEAAAEMSKQCSVLVRQIIHTLEGSPHKSEARDFAKQNLQQAAFWLRHEIEGEQES